MSTQPSRNSGHRRVPPVYAPKNKPKQVNQKTSPRESFFAPSNSPEKQQEIFGAFIRGISNNNKRNSAPFANVKPSDQSDSSKFLDGLRGKLDNLPGISGTEGLAKHLNTEDRRNVSEIKKVADQFCAKDKDKSTVPPSSRQQLSIQGQMEAPLLCLQI